MYHTPSQIMEDPTCTCIILYLYNILTYHINFLLEILHHSSLLVHFFLNKAEPEFGVDGGVVHISRESVHHLTGSSNRGHRL